VIADGVVYHIRAPQTRALATQKYIFNGSGVHPMSALLTSSETQFAGPQFGRARDKGELHMFKAILSVVLLSLVSGCVTSESPTSQQGRSTRAAQAKPAAGGPPQVILGTAY
jgi:hypothetical protein